MSASFPSSASLYGPATAFLVPRVPADPGPRRQNESEFADAQAALIQAITDAYSPWYTVEVIRPVSLLLLTDDGSNRTTSNPIGNLFGVDVDFGAYCYGLNAECNGDNRDARYTATNLTYMFVPQADILHIVVGADHEATGMALYGNVAIYNVAKQVAVVGASGAQYAGSADAYLRGGPHSAASPYLYAYMFARDCTGRGPYCAAVARTGFPALPDFDVDAGPPTGIGFFIDRAYVNPATGVGPASLTVLFPTHLRLVPRLPAWVIPTAVVAGVLLVLAVAAVGVAVTIRVRRARRSTSGKEGVSAASAGESGEEREATEPTETTERTPLRG